MNSTSETSKSPNNDVSLRLTGGIVIVIATLIAVFVPRFFVAGTTIQFFGMVLGPGVGGVCLLLWWLIRSRAPVVDRFLGVGVLIVVLGGTFFLLHPSMPIGMSIYGVPTIMLATMLGFVLLRSVTWKKRRVLVGVVMTLTALYWTLVRFDGVDGTVSGAFSWRWEPTAEQVYLAELANRGTSVQPHENTDTKAIELGDQDWPEFRGAGRTGHVFRTTIKSNWDDDAPKQVWSRAIGPGWSSFSVVDGRLFTQEQRGDEEIVLCLDATTGNDIWTHEEETRFSEAMAGPGPRATPTFHEGSIYSLGATGRLNCLNVATGEPKWMRDVAKDSSTKVPEWGFSSSPLVVGDTVVVFAGGRNGQSVNAYDTTTGEIRWQTGNGTLSYSSPQLVTVDDQPQILMHDNLGITSFHPDDGAQLWQFEWEIADRSRVVQPALVDQNKVLMAMGYSLGARLFEVSRDGDTWQTEELWESRSLKPYYNDFVVYDGHAYGFDSEIFTCVDLATGKRAWKGGRYGNGQVILLADQGWLLVLSEKGEIVLLEANPRKRVELGKTRAIEGKTWNHPVVVGDRIYVRNGEQAACFQLPSEK